MLMTKPSALKTDEYKLLPVSYDKHKTGMNALS